ncbi:MAG: CPBP family intramembrane metalloprotease [Bacteroidia bacterium]|nr:CPBP family intramembrane metalloprotease [Bacteroidia bacterium]
MTDERNDNGERSLAAALRTFIAEARRTPRDVTTVFLTIAALGILSVHVGSKRFFTEQWYSVLGADPLFELYQYLYWFGSEFVVYFLLPLLVIVLIHRRPLRGFGLGVGDWRFGLKISALFYLVMLPILWVVSDMPMFQQVYPHAASVRGDWTLFLLYEGAFLLYFIGWEFIWRGYTVFGLAPHTGPAVAVFVQMIPFVILHYGKPLPETIGSIAAAIALGALSLRVRSFWYAVLIHWSVMLTIDLLSTLRFRSGAHGIGIEALRAIFSLLGA